MVDGRYEGCNADRSRSTQATPPAEAFEEADDGGRRVDPAAVDAVPRASGIGMAEVVPALTERAPGQRPWVGARAWHRIRNGRSPIMWHSGFTLRLTWWSSAFRTRMNGLRCFHRTPAYSGRRQADPVTTALTPIRRRTLTGSTTRGTTRGHATRQNAAKRSPRRPAPPRPARRDPADIPHRTTPRRTMTSARTMRDKAQAMEGRATEEPGRITRQQADSAPRQDRPDFRKPEAGGREGRARRQTVSTKARGRVTAMITR